MSPFIEPGKPGTPIKVRWSYTTETIVDDGVPTLFDTTWTYIYRGWRSQLQWGLSRYPGDEMVVHEDNVPEIVKLAVMVIV